MHAFWWDGTCRNDIFARVLQNISTFAPTLKESNRLPGENCVTTTIALRSLSNIPSRLTDKMH